MFKGGDREEVGNKRLRGFHTDTGAVKRQNIKDKIRYNPAISPKKIAFFSGV